MQQRRSIVTFAVLSLIVASAVPALGAQEGRGGGGRGAAGKATAPTTDSAGAVTATCNDGSRYRGDSRSGACTGHGGVKRWGDGSVAPRPKGATAQCADGSWYTKPGRKGACAGHGGVKQWVKG